jgi:hypothetical protein
MTYAGQERFQLAIYLLPEHGMNPCNPCPLERLRVDLLSDASDPIEALERNDLPNALDWLRAELMAYLCGSSELPDRLWCPDHTLVSIDHESMFSTSRSSLTDCRWLKGPTGDLRGNAMRVAIRLCESFGRIGDEELCGFVEVPREYEVHAPWSIAGRLSEARDAAAAFAASHRFP